MHGNRILLLMIVIAILMAFSLIGCTGAASGNGSTPTASPTLVLQDTTVSAQGEVVPEKWASLAFTSGGSDLNIRVSVGNSVKLGELLASVNDLAQKAAVSNANAALSSAQANLKRLQDLKASDSDISVTQKAVDAAQASLDAAQESLDETELKAPFDGVIVNIFLQDFEIAPPGQPVIQLADLTSLVVQTTDLGEVDFARVQINDPVTVVFDALPDVTGTGRVTRTALHPETGAGTYYTVTIKLDEIPENLRWGMSSFVEIKTVANTPEAALVSITPSTQTSVPPTRTLNWGYPTATLTLTPTFIPSKTPRPHIPPSAATSTSGGGYQVPASPTATWTPTTTPQPTATFTLSPPTATFTPTETPQPLGSPTATRTHPPIGGSTSTATATPTP